MSVENDSRRNLQQGTPAMVPINSPSSLPQKLQQQPPNSFMNSNQINEMSSNPNSISANQSDVYSLHPFSMQNSSQNQLYPDVCDVYRCHH